MSIKTQEINEFFNEDLSEMTKNNNNEINSNENKEPDSSRSSLDWEKINYFSDSENLKQSFF